MRVLHVFCHCTVFEVGAPTSKTSQLQACRTTTCQGYTVCSQCRNKLLVRRDRPSPVVIYDDEMGAIPGSHFHKYCINRRCGFTQYYGYYTKRSFDSQPEVYFDHDWESNPYFVSSRETAFSMKLMHRFHSQILIGQQSFKQCAEVYNYLHNVLKLKIQSPVISLYVYFSYTISSLH